MKATVKTLTMFALLGAMLTVNDADAATARRRTKVYGAPTNVVSTLKHKRRYEDHVVKVRVQPSFNLGGQADLSMQIMDLPISAGLVGEFVAPSGDKWDAQIFGVGALAAFHFWLS